MIAASLEERDDTLFAAGRISDRPVSIRTQMELAFLRLSKVLDQEDALSAPCSISNEQKQLLYSGFEGFAAMHGQSAPMQGQAGPMKETAPKG